MKRAPVESIYVLYWRDSQLSYRHNTFTREIAEAAEEYLDAPVRQKGFEFVMANINRLTDEYRRNKSRVEKHRGQKLKRWPLVVLDEGSEYIVVDSQSKLKRVEKLFESIYEYYFH